MKATARDTIDPKGVAPDTARSPEVTTPLYGARMFYVPDKSLRVLALLDNIRFGNRLTQQQLGQATGLSGTMVNNYIKQLRAEGLIDARPIDGKHIEYRLTEAGSNLASRRLDQFCAELVRIYASLKDSIRNRLREALPPGTRTVAFFGAAGTCEVTLAVLKDMDLRVTSIVDNDPAKQGQVFHGHVVAAPETLAQASCDAVIITSYVAHQEIRRQIEPLLSPRGIRVCTL